MLYVSRGSCVLRIGVIGINFKTADLNLREAIARGAEAFADERGLFSPHPVVLLSTCNRTEIYFSAEELSTAHSDLLALLRERISEPFEHRLYSYFGIDCFAHLAKVTAGLDSAILAETEIQRQVKGAYARSCEIFSLSGCLHYLFQKALKIGKEVRSQLELERGAPTLYGMIWQTAEKILGKIDPKKVLIVGNSEINRGLISLFNHKGLHGFSLSTRNPLSARFEGVKIYDRSILSHWQNYDLIICASKAEDYLIEGKSDRKHLIFDLSVPRNVNPEVETKSVRLLNIEQLNRMIEQKRQGQNDCMEKCDQFIWQNVLRLARIYRLKTERSIKIPHVLGNGGMG